MDDVKTLLERVRKLLSLASSPNMHEAASAAAMAQTLIARHRLERWLEAEQVAADDPDPVTDGRDTPLEVGRRLRTWKVVLATTLAEANGCFAYTFAVGDEQGIAIAGRARDRSAVAELWGFLVKRIEWLSATHGQGQPRYWHEAFRVGAVDTVAERLRSIADEVRGGLPEAALVRVDPLVAADREALDRFVEANLRLGKGRPIRVDARAWEHGRSAGAELDLPRRAPGNTGLRRRR